MEGGLHFSATSSDQQLSLAIEEGRHDSSQPSKLRRKSQYDCAKTLAAR